MLHNAFVATVVNGDALKVNFSATKKTFQKHNHNVKSFLFFCLI